MMPPDIPWRPVWPNCSQVIPLCGWPKGQCKFWEDMDIPQTSPSNASSETPKLPRFTKVRKRSSESLSTAPSPRSDGVAEYPIAEIRSRFPGLQRRINGYQAIFFDGPGGSQSPESVGDAVKHYLLHQNANVLQQVYLHRIISRVHLSQ